MFVQIMKLETTRFDEIQGLVQQWRDATEGQRTLRREIIARDEQYANQYVILAFFDSAADVAKNSALPMTSELAAKVGVLCDAPIVFQDLAILSDRT